MPASSTMQEQAGAKDIEAIIAAIHVAALQELQPYPKKILSDSTYILKGWEVHAKAEMDRLSNKAVRSKRQRRRNVQVAMQTAHATKLETASEPMRLLCRTAPARIPEALQDYFAGEADGVMGDADIFYENIKSGPMQRCFVD